MKVGDYVRNQYGIAKLVNIEKSNVDIYVFDRDVCFLVNKDTGEIKKRINKLPITEYIDLNKIKSSQNIIDLIEAGDYVNGYKVDFVQNNEVVFNHNHPRQLNIIAKDIKSIVTKEQLECMEYRIGSDKE